MPCYCLGAFVNADRIEHFRKRLQDLAEEISNDLAANKDDAGIVELDTSIRQTLPHGCHAKPANGSRAA